MNVIPVLTRRQRALVLTLPWVLVAGCHGAVGPNGTSAGGSATSGGSGNGSGAGAVVDPNAPIVGLPATSSRLVRLNSKQWENSVQDLLHLPMPTGYSSEFVTESLVTTFDTNGSILEVDSNQWAGYRRAAQQVAEPRVR